MKSFSLMALVGAMVLSAQAASAQEQWVTCALDVQGGATQYDVPTGLVYDRKGLNVFKPEEIEDGAALNQARATPGKTSLRLYTTEGNLATFEASEIYAYKVGSEVEIGLLGGQGFQFSYNNRNRKKSGTLSYNGRTFDVRNCQVVGN